MNLSLLHNHPARQENTNQSSEDIAAIVAQQLDDIEQSAHAPSELSESRNDIHLEERTPSNPPKAIEQSRENATTFSQNEQIEYALREATRQQTISDIKNHSSSTQKFLQLLFRDNIFILIIDLLRASIFRPIPVITASFLSLMSGLVLFILSATNNVPIYASIILLSLMGGYALGWCIDIVELRRARTNP